MTKTPFLSRVAVHLVVAAVLFCIPALVVNYVVYGTLSVALSTLGLLGLVCRVTQVATLVSCAYTAFLFECERPDNE